MQKLAAALICAVAALGGGAGLMAQDEDWRSPKLRIEWAAFTKLHDAGKVVVVDVREAAAFEGARIPGALNVPLPEVEKRVAELKKHGKPIVLYCA